MSRFYFMDKNRSYIKQNKIACLDTTAQWGNVVTVRTTVNVATLIAVPVNLKSLHSNNLHFISPTVQKS